MRRSAGGSSSQPIARWVNRAGDCSRQRRYSYRATRRRVTALGDSPAAASPSNAGSAWRKSPVDRPCRYNSGITSATFGDLRRYGGRILLVKRCRSPSTTRLSSICVGEVQSICGATCGSGGICGGGAGGGGGGGGTYSHDDCTAGAKLK